MSIRRNHLFEGLHPKAIQSAMRVMTKMLIITESARQHDLRLGFWIKELPDGLRRFTHRVAIKRSRGEYRAEWNHLTALDTMDDLTGRFRQARLAYSASLPEDLRDDYEQSMDEAMRFLMLELRRNRGKTVLTLPVQNARVLANLCDCEIHV